MLGNAARRGKGRPPGSIEFRRLLADLDAREQAAVPPPSAHSIDEARRARSEALAMKRSLSDCDMNNAGSFGWLSIPSLAIGSDIQDRIVRAVQAFQTSGSQLICENMQAMYHHLFVTKRKVANLSAEAASLDCERKRLASGLQEGACFLVQFSGYMVGSLITKLRALAATGLYEPMMLIINRKYDETPSKITVSFKRPTVGVEKEQNSTAKVVQTKCSLSMLYKHRDTGQHCFMQTCIPTWLQAVDRTTAENTLAVQKDILECVAALDTAYTFFPVVVQQVTTDKYSANLKAEVFLNKQINEDAQRAVTSHYTCDIHKVAAMQSKTLAFVTGHVSALIAGSLALGETGSVRSLRQSLHAVLAQKVKVLFGAPPKDEFNDNFRRAVLDAFLPVPTSGVAKKKVLWRRAVISYFLNDDLQEVDHVCFWTPRWNADRGQVIDAMARFLVPALLPCKAPMFFRSKWTGFEGSYQWFGLLAACHGLLKPMLLHYLGSAAWLC